MDKIKIVADFAPELSECTLHFSYGSYLVPVNIVNTPQPLYNTVFGVQANFRVSYPNYVITRVK